MLKMGDCTQPSVWGKPVVLALVLLHRPPSYSHGRGLSPNLKLGKWPADSSHFPPSNPSVRIVGLRDHAQLLSLY